MNDEETAPCVSEWMCVHMHVCEREREIVRASEESLKERNRQNVDRCICLPTLFGFQIEILAMLAKSDFPYWASQCQGFACREGDWRI